MNKDNEYYLKPKKLFSQNFLIDQNIAKKIANSLVPTINDCIIEIGCGSGSLTKFLLEKKCKVIGTEIDRDAIGILNKLFPIQMYSNFSLIQMDILKIEIKRLLSELSYNKDFKFFVAGNLPYRITSEIFFWLFNQKKNIKQAVLMVQKEVARRMVAKPRTKEYGILTVAMELSGNCKILFDVPPTCFEPQPKVTSSVISMEFNGTIDVQDFSDIMELVRASFNHRRKTLKNGLMDYLNKILDFDKKKISNFIIENNVNYFKKRAEELTTNDFIKLKNLVYKLK